jgi:hypothetical protein
MMIASIPKEKTRKPRKYKLCKSNNDPKNNKIIPRIIPEIDIC